jgi:hypothetical protein
MNNFAGFGLAALLFLGVTCPAAAQCVTPSDPSGHVTDGLKAADNGDGTYTVSDGTGYSRTVKASSPDQAKQAMSYDFRHYMAQKLCGNFGGLD